MHIAHISTSVTLNQTVFNQMVYQQKQGHRVVALCPDDEWTKPIKYKDIPVIHVPFLWHDAKASMTSALWRTYQICRQEKFDVVHTHTLLPGWPAFPALFIHSTPGNPIFTKAWLLSGGLM